MSRRPRPPAAPHGAAPDPVGVIDHPKPADALTGPLAYRLDALARALGVSRRALERERAAGRFPAPDRVIGRMPIWRVETVRAWLEGGGA